MDKEQFYAEMVDKLRAAAAQLQLEFVASPSTLSQSVQEEERRPRLDRAVPRVADLRARVEAIHADPAPLSDAVKADVEAKWNEITQLLTRQR
jgi:hypothetical protein